MKKAYLLVFNEVFGTQAELTNVLKQMSGVTHWRYDLPNAFYLVSADSAKELGIKLRELIGDKGLFILCEINDNSWGWLTNESWYLIRNKEYKPKST